MSTTKRIVKRIPPKLVKLESDATGPVIFDADTDDADNGELVDTFCLGNAAIATGEKKLTARQWAVLEAFRVTGNVRGAIRKVGVGKTAFYRWLSSNVLFRQHYEAMRDAVADVLESTMLDQAINGVREPVYYQGQVIGTIRRFDSSLQRYMLRRFRPEYDKDHSRVMEPTAMPPATGGNEVIVNVAGDATFTIDDRRARLLAIIAAERERRSQLESVGSDLIASSNGNGHHGPTNGSANGNGKH